MSPVIPIIIIVIIGFFLFRLIRRNSSGWKLPKEPFPIEWRIILKQEVAFYNSLSDEEKIRFEYKVQEFLLNCRITGIETSVDGWNGWEWKYGRHDDLIQASVETWI